MTMSNRQFRLTEDHIKLLRRMYVGWSFCEYGAPEIDPKRPYGNSWVEGDIHEILTGKSQKFYDLDNDLRDEYRKLHLETKNALQIVLQTGEFKPGLYQSDNYSSNWKLVSE